MENLREATGSLESMAGSLQTNVETLSKRADSTLTAFESMAGSIDREITVTSKDARSLIASLKETAGNLNGATSELEEMLAENREPIRSEEHTSELQSLMSNSYAVFCLEKKNINTKLIRNRYVAKNHNTNNNT